RIVELQKKHQPDNCRIVNGLQTNGTLLDEDWCHFLAAENFVVGISLDGPEDLNSIYRHTTDGRSVFREILNGYQLLKLHGIPCEILCVVNAVNVEHPLRVYRFFKDLQAEFITFLPLVEVQISGEKKVSERTVPSKAFGKFLCAIFDEWKANDIGKIKVQIFEEALRTAFDLEHTLCIFKRTCGAVPVIEHNGDFYSCDHFVNPEHLIGNIRETSLVDLLECQEQKAFGQAKLTTLPDYCLNCEVLSMCNGACPKDRFIETPDGEPGLNYLCEGYKLFFNHCKPFVEEVAEAWNSPIPNPSPK
ncbi:MAG TPA: SPASM domain-containing protein, partial [Prolixibacteraceae bacterium]